MTRGYWYWYLFGTLVTAVTALTVAVVLMVSMGEGHGTPDCVRQACPSVTPFPPGGRGL